MKTIRMMVMGLAVVALVGLNSGCLSYMATEAHNGRVTTNKALQIGRMNNGAPSIGVDLLSITPGYMAAWSESPGTMTAATISDIITTGGAAYLGYKAINGGSSGGGSPAVSVTGNGNNVNYNGGGGTQTTSTDNSTRAGGE